METHDIVKGTDWGLEVRVMAGDGHGKPIRLTVAHDAPIGSGSLTVKPDHPALASGDKLLLGEDVVLTLDGACAAGSPTLPVEDTAIAIDSGAVLAKIQDISAYTMQAEALASRGDATPVIAAGSFTVTPATQTGADRGKVTVTCAAAVTALLTVGSYYLALWRQDSGNKRPVYEATLRVTEAGFLS